MKIILDREEIYQAFRAYVEDKLGIDIDEGVTNLFDGPSYEVTSAEVRIVIN